MAKNQALSFKNLKDVLFSEKEITKNVERENIFEIKDIENNSLGFISSYDLKSFIIEHGEESVEYNVKNLDSNQWVSIFSHPSFQRRRPQLVTPVVLDPDLDPGAPEYYILKNGQKDGPYEKNDLLNKLEQKQILLTDMVTMNGGLTWLKLFQVDNFERRVLKESDQLPGIPDQAVEGSSHSVAPSIPSSQTITNLANLSSLMRGKSTDKLDTNSSEVVTQNKSNNIYMWLLVASILSITYFAFQIKKQLSSPFKNNETRIGEQAEMLTPVEVNEIKPVPQATQIPNKNVGEKKNINQINDTQRNTGKFAPRVLKPIVPAEKKSFMDTSSYQNIQVGSEQEDQNYFYDNTSPIELDPVRSQVSKENFDDSTTEGEGQIPTSDNLFENEIPASAN